MKYTGLFDTDIKLSRIGFGGEQLGGYGWGITSEKEMTEAIRKAIDNGVNLFDTAPIYGLGHSEEILGKTLANHRKNVIISTKVGLRWGENAAAMKKTQASPIKKTLDSSPRNIRMEVEASLKRLNTDYIDIYHIHWPDAKTPIEETLSAMKELVEAGKIRCIGCCNFNMDLLKEALKYADIKSIQVPYNLIDRKAEVDILPLCLDQNIAVITYSPLARGLLPGKYQKTSGFGLDDHRSRSNDEYFQGEAFLQNLEIFKRLKSVAEKLNATPAQIALRWVLHNPCVTTTLIGVKNVTQLEENLSDQELSLSVEDMDVLDGGATNVY